MCVVEVYGLVYCFGSKFSSWCVVYGIVLRFFGICSIVLCVLVFGVRLDLD